MFSTLKKQVASQFATMLTSGNTLLRVAANKDKLVEAYLSGFPEKLRQENTCNACNAFIRQVGDAVLVTPALQLITVWDIRDKDVPAEYVSSVRNIRKYVASLPFQGMFTLSELEVGKDRNYSDKWKVNFDHFYVNFPEFMKSPKRFTVAGEFNTTVELFRRGLAELSDDSLDIVLELIAQKRLYKGNEFQLMVQQFRDVKKQWTDSKDKEMFIWHSVQRLPTNVMRIKNVSIGQLLSDISEGKPLEVAVASFEKMVAPSNYQRTTALVTPSMITSTKKKLEELGMIYALERRKLDTRDLGPHNALFVHRKQTATTDVFAKLTAEAPVSVQTLSKCSEMPIEAFLKDVLPTVKSVRLLVENRLFPNFVTLTGAVDPASKGIFKWGTSFGWSYTGGVADSLRDQVVKLGGRVDGVLRFTHSWNHDGKNQSLMDLHVFLPTHGQRLERVSDTYGNNERVGWNHRKHDATKGVQDVDFVNEPKEKVPVENITFPSMHLLPEGKYVFRIHNWAKRHPCTSGFRAEIECNGEVHEYDHPKPLGHKEWVTVAEATLRNGVFTMNHKLPVGATASKQKWGVTSNQWRQVSTITLSPNHWEKPVGNKHYFFLLEGCISDEKTRPFYNEFLCDELRENRKVMEVLADNIQVADAEGAELSGLGFSDTVRTHVYLEVEGRFRSVIKVTI